MDYFISKNFRIPADKIVSWKALNVVNNFSKTELYTKYSYRLVTLNVTLITKLEVYDYYLLIEDYDIDSTFEAIAFNNPSQTSLLVVLPPRISIVWNACDVSAFNEFSFNAFTSDYITVYKTDSVFNGEEYRSPRIDTANITEIQFYIE